MFGIVDTQHTPSLGYMEIVDRRNAATLLPIIQSHTRPGSIIRTDEWAAYNRISSIPGVAAHETVNHSLHFVDPATLVHTQNVESYWNRVKTKLKRMKGVTREQLPSYLDEFMWRERKAKTHGVALTAIMNAIADVYPLP